MKYAVLTAKHVSGFCLWDSKLTDYTVMHPDCPYQQDLFAQFVESFTKRGLKVGVYYCWRNPGFDDKNPDVHKVIPPECDPATHSLAEQSEFHKAQIRELLETFPEIFYVWNDGLDPRIMPREEAQAFAASLGPDVICSANWWDWSRKGEPFVDIAVTEVRHFPQDTVELGETCWKLDGWFWHEGEEPRSYEHVREAMETAFSKGCNFLLNVGPDKNGMILPESAEILAQLGRDVMGVD